MEWYNNSIEEQEFREGVWELLGSKDDCSFICLSDRGIDKFQEKITKLFYMDYSIEDAVLCLCTYYRFNSKMLKEG